MTKDILFQKLDEHGSMITEYSDGSRRYTPKGHAAAVAKFQETHPKVGEKTFFCHQCGKEITTAILQWPDGHRGLSHFH